MPYFSKTQPFARPNPTHEARNQTLKVFSSCKAPAPPRSVPMCATECDLRVTRLITVRRKTAWTRSAKSLQCGGDRLFSTLACMCVCVCARHTVTLLPTERATCHKRFTPAPSRVDLNAAEKPSLPNVVFIFSHKGTRKVKDVLHTDGAPCGQTPR